MIGVVQTGVNEGKSRTGVMISVPGFSMYQARLLQHNSYQVMVVSVISIPMITARHAIQQKFSDTTQLFTTSNFIGPWYHAALLFLGLGSIVLLFVLLFS